MRLMLLVCDHPDCEAEFSFEPSKEGGALRACYTAARKAGWHANSYVGEWCPDHRPPTAAARVAQAVEAVKAGSTIYGACKEAGCHRRTLTRELKAAGVQVLHKVRPPQIKEDDLRALWPSYLNGETTLEALAARYGVRPGSLRQASYRFNLERIGHRRRR